MGANAQIEVPAFTAGQVLTAAEMTQINTGIPVFATTTTRDAAFGGAGEKVLAQGQFAFIEATDSLLVYNGSAWVAAGAVSAVDVNRVTTGQATTSTTYTGLTTAQTITMTTGTKALVLLSYNSNQERDIFTYASVAVSGATTIAASDANSANFQQVGVGGYTGTASTAIPLTLTAGSNTFTMQFKNSSSASVTYSYRAMTVIAYS
jgi:hypothetical protein